VPAGLLKAKMHIPSLASEHVPRPRLVARLQQGLTQKFTLISTPTGFGKTSLVCEWLTSYKHATAWISLDESDNNHSQFIGYIIAALHSLNIWRDGHLQPDVFEGGSDVPFETSIASLINSFGILPGSQEPAILILDDYHVITNPEIHHSIAFLLEYLPKGMHVVIVTRSDPPLPLARMRVRRQINELRPQDLQFTREETEAFLNQISKLGLSTEQVAALDERTEGWIAGLQLAALAISGHPDSDHFVRAFTGSHRYVLDYLMDEVFTRQTEDIRTFLLQTAILERMSVGLCNAVTGREDSHKVLEQLQRENMFLVPLDSQNQWYRYHHLFSDLLIKRVEDHQSQDILSLHYRAAVWFDAHQQPNEAIKHALGAREYDLAVDLMVRATPSLALQSEVSTLLQWLRLLPAELKESNPRISLMYAWVHFFMTDISAVEIYIQDALRVMGLTRAAVDKWPEKISHHNAELLAQVNALETFVAVNRGDPARAINIANYALWRLPKNERLGRFAVLVALGDAYRDSDNFAAASQTYTEALTISETTDQYAASLAIRMDLARLRFKMGQLRHAESICREVLAWCGESFHPLFPVIQSNTLLGDILRERNDLDGAEKILSTSIRQCELAGYQRYQVLSLISTARLMFARGNQPAVEKSLQTAEQIAAISGSELLQAWVRQFGARLIKKQYSAGWLKTSQLSLADEGVFQREDEYLTLVRLHLDLARYSRMTDPKEVFRLLDRLLASSQKSARNGSAIEILILQALTMQIMGKTPDALQKIKQALSLAEAEGYMRLFVDEGPPMADLLVLAVRDGIHPTYARQLVGLMETGEQGMRLMEGSSKPLSEREVEILRLLASGSSNQEIMEKLIISMSTVKTHISHIFTKLDVTSRTQAIARARDLRLIE
jgi:LuxR family maltose regulon positive regulatory protein